MLDATTITTEIEAPAPQDKPTEPIARFTRKCPECGDTFKTSHRGKEFCIEAHRVAFANRCAARGKVLIPLAMGWRNARGRKGIGAQAMSEMVQLLDQFAAEDAKANRPNVTHYTDRLLNHGTNMRWKDGRRHTRSA